MDQEKISSVIDTAFSSAFKDWERQIEKELYPSAFPNEFSWLHVKNSIKINNQVLKEALTKALCELLQSKEL